MSTESTPPIDHIAAVAKHGTDDELLALRSDIRWLALWAQDALDELRALWECATVTLGPEHERDGYVMRSVSVTAELSPNQIAALSDLVSRSA